MRDVDQVRCYRITPLGHDGIEEGGGGGGLGGGGLGGGGLDGGSGNCSTVAIVMAMAMAATAAMEAMVAEGCERCRYASQGA